MSSNRRILRRLTIIALLSPATAQTQSALRFTLPYGRFAVGFKSVDQYGFSGSFGGDRIEPGPKQ
jgi:hypothetical protein